jgi:Spy/CpxP family protein refolding chaperone
VPEFVDKRLAAGIAVVLLGISAVGMAAAHADEPTPPPAPTTTAPTAPASTGTSSTDELADMVMDALEGQ